MYVLVQNLYIWDWESPPSCMLSPAFPVQVYRAHILRPPWGSASAGSSSAPRPCPPAAAASGTRRPRPQCATHPPTPTHYYWRPPTRTCSPPQPPAADRNGQRIHPDDQPSRQPPPPRGCRRGSTRPAPAAAISGVGYVPSQILVDLRGSRISDTHLPPRYTGWRAHAPQRQWRTRRVLLLLHLTGHSNTTKPSLRETCWKCYDHDRPWQC